MASPTFDIPVDDDTSELVDLNGTTLVGLFVPTGFDGTTITFQTTLDGVTWYDVEDGAGADYEVTVGTVPCYVPIPPTTFAGIRIVRIVTGTTQTTTGIVIGIAARGI